MVNACHETTICYVELSHAMAQHSMACPKVMVDSNTYKILMVDANIFNN
jgi:hypothetical protein